MFGESPPAREAHICQVIGEVLIIHGGLNQAEESFYDLWVLVGLGRKVDKIQAEMSICTRPGNPSQLMTISQLNLRNSRANTLINSENGQTPNEYLRWVKSEQIG